MFEANLSDPEESPVSELEASELEMLLQFTQSLNGLSYKSCENCDQRFLTDLATFNRCNACTKIANKFTHLNNMNPRPVPLVLIDLTPTEQMLIARVHPVLRVYKLKAAGGAGQYKYKGNIINVEQDIQSLATSLPLLPRDLNIILIRRAGMNCYEDFRVRRYKIQDALIWLIKNHQFYSDLTIDYDALNQLPVDGNIADSLRYLDEAEIVTEATEEDNVAENGFANVAC